jgi:hypothetical protein
LLSWRALAGLVGHPPLSAVCQGVEARVVRRPVERRVVFEVDRNELGIAEGVELVG